MNLRVLILTVVAILFLVSAQSDQTVEESRLIEQLRRVYSGVILSAKRISTITGQTFILIARLSSRDGLGELELIQPFAGTYRTLWRGGYTFNQYSFRNGLDIDIQDLNKDGLPELFWNEVVVGTKIGTAYFVLLDFKTKVKYEVEVAVYPEGRPGEVVLGDTLATAALYRGFLEGKVAQSPYITDRRSAETKFIDGWIDLFLAFLTQDNYTVSIEDTVTASSRDKECNLDQPAKRITLGRLEYVSTSYKLIELDRVRGKCSLIFVPFASLTFDKASIENLRATPDGKIRWDVRPSSINKGGVVQFDPKTRELTWVSVR